MLGNAFPTHYSPMCLLPHAPGDSWGILPHDLGCFLHSSMVGDFVLVWLSECAAMILNYGVFRGRFSSLTQREHAVRFLHVFMLSPHSFMPRNPFLLLLGEWEEENHNFGCFFIPPWLGISFFVWMSECVAVMPDLGVSRGFFSFVT